MSLYHLHFIDSAGHRRAIRAVLLALMFGVYLLGLAALMAHARYRLTEPRAASDSLESIGMRALNRLVDPPPLRAADSTPSNQPTSNQPTSNEPTKIDSAENRAPQEKSEDQGSAEQVRRQPVAATPHHGHRIRWSHHHHRRGHYHQAGISPFFHSTARMAGLVR